MTALDVASRLVLGQDKRQRIPLRRTLLSAAVYALAACTLYPAVRFGFVTVFSARYLCLFIAAGVAAFYVAIRTGLTLRLRDASVTAPQMAYAICCGAAAYLANPAARGISLLPVALVLFYGAFTVSRRGCRAMGVVAVAGYGSAMALGAWRAPLVFDVRVELLHGLMMIATFPAIAFLAGELSQLRTDQRSQKIALREALARIAEIATRDDLTGLPNRRHVQEWMSHETARRDRSGGELSIAVLDLDHFKRVNDTYGHLVGDRALQIFARAARSIFRDGDVLARWGGEEFLLVMPDTALPGARRAIERFRSCLAQPATWAECPEAQTTFSAGLTAHAPYDSLERAVERADGALYKAKRQGRNRTVLEGGLDGTLVA